MNEGKPNPIQKSLKIESKKHDPSLKFHHLTKLKKIVQEQPSNKWPDTWKKIHFKRYLRFPRISLKEYETKSELEKLLMLRKSNRKFSGKAISLLNLSYLMKFSIGIREKKTLNWHLTTRPYPSAGARYPCEIYTIVFNVKHVEPGIYHYDFKEHALELVLRGQLNKKFVEITGLGWIKNVGVLFLITAILGRSRIKYGSRAYRHTLIEAGHIGQNLYLVSAKRGLKCCAVGGYLDTEIEKLLDVDGNKEFTIYIIAVGS